MFQCRTLFESKIGYSVYNNVVQYGYIIASTISDKYAYIYVKYSCVCICLCMVRGYFVIVKRLLNWFDCDYQ